MRGRWEPSDTQWKLIERILRPQRRADGRGRPWRDTRAVLNGILWVLGTGAQWRELPNKYPPYQTCHRRFQQWVRSGTMRGVLEALAADLRVRGVLNVDEAFIEGSFAPAKKGAPRLGKQNEAKDQKSWPWQTATRLSRSHTRKIRSSLFQRSNHYVRRRSPRRRCN